MSDRTVVVVGAGVAGTSAAWAARRNGAKVHLISGGAGASALMSGALDFAGWQVAPRSGHEPALDATACALLDALGIWQVAERPVRVATMTGNLRTARGADRALLDVAALSNVRVAVPRLARPAWDADLVARGCSAEPWAKERGVRFEAVDCSPLFDDADARASDADLAALFDDASRVERIVRALRAACDRHDAVLLGPWLGLRTDGSALLREAIGRPAGETLSMLAGAAGARFETAAERVLRDAEVKRSVARATALRRSDGRFACEHDGDEGPFEADAVVMACGGLIGGGICFTPSEANAAGVMPEASSEPFAMSLKSEACLALDGRFVGRTGSLHGPNLEDYGWPSIAEARSVLERIGVRRDGVRALDREAQAVPGLFVAGSAAADARHTVLDSLAAGIEAGLAAAS
ncbi:MAG: FAD-binding protein [Deltaproteobacteria bacterium]|nr:FAD-binding protein [Deltaproteobacteria bacterium]